jgi:hypothetical protein
MKKIAAALCFFALLLSSSGVWGAEPIPGSEPGWYQCTGDGQEKTVSEKSAKSPVVESPKTEATAAKPAAETKPSSGEVKSPLINKVRDAYSMGRPAAKEVTVVVGKIPASYLKFAKGHSIGTVAVGSKKSVRGTTVPAGQDNKAGQVQSLTVFEEKFDDDSRIFCSDRWYNNSLLDDEKRGETVIFNLSGRHEKLKGGMFLKNDAGYIGLVAKTYGTPAPELLYWTVEIQDLDRILRVVLHKKIRTPDGIRYTSIDIPVFKKLWAQPALTSFIGRFLNNGGAAIGIPPELVGTLTNVIVAVVTAFFDTRHNIPCLSTLKGGVERFELDQKFYESGGALTARDFERVKKESAAFAAGSGSGLSKKIESATSTGGGQNLRTTGNAVEEVLAQIQPAPPTGYAQSYHWPGFWLEPKRVEWPSGGGMFQSPQLQTKYAFSNTYLHLFGGEVAPNATFHWGPSHKIDHWKYRTNSGYPGRGHFFGIGGSTELVTRHSWGGTDNRFAFWYGYEQKDKGRSHRDSRNPWMFEWQTELWWDGIKLGKDGKFGTMLDGAKVGVLAKTNDFALAWLFPVLYRTPHDIAKVSVGPKFLYFFSRDGDEPKGGGLGVQVELLDGIGGRFSWFPFKRGTYLTGWADPYRVYNKIQELRAEFGIYEIPWDPYFPKAVPVAVEVAPPIAVAP